MSDNPRSRIMRETMWILTKVRSFAEELIEEQDRSKLRINKVLLLLYAFMLTEDGNRLFSVSEIANNSGLHRSSTGRDCKWFVDVGIFDEVADRYTLNVATPKFLINPEELYQRPIVLLKDIDYAEEDRIKVFIREEMRKQMSLTPTIDAMAIMDSNIDDRTETEEEDTF